MTVGFCGLGLIGGSMAKAYRKNSDMTLLGCDMDKTIENFAILSEVIDGSLTDEKVKDCDLIYIALYPNDAIEYLKHIAPIVRQDAIVMDLCGTKKSICEIGFSLSRQYGFTYVGAHPMAGTQYSGFKHSKASMFKGASLIIVPPVYDDIAFYDKIKKLTAPAEFSEITVTTAEKHDKMIAFTSQLAHIVSNAYVKSPTAQEHKGFSAGSYKDLTRVAWLNENMWTPLFLENRENLINELDSIISSLNEYRVALQQNDAKTLCTLLKDGRISKEKVDGNSKAK